MTWESWWVGALDKRAYKNIHKIQMIRIFGFLMHPQHPLFQKFQVQYIFLVFTRRP